MGGAAGHEISTDRVQSSEYSVISFFEAEFNYSIIDLQVGSDAIFFGLRNLGLKIVAMSYEMSLCFGSTQPEPATDVRRTDRASKHA